VKRNISFFILIFFLANLLVCNAAGEQAQISKEQSLTQFPEEGVPVLMYHSIGSQYHCSICVSEKQFKEQMEWLSDNGYHTINLDQFYEALSGNASLPENPVMITFDDGFADNYRVAWPILKEFGFNATFFIVTSQVNPYNIDWGELKELIRQGNSIGSHSVNHFDLTTLNTRQQEQELRESREALEKNLGVKVKAFCFPYGNYNKTTLALLPETGYVLSFTTFSGKVHYGDNEYLLRRIHIWGGKPVSDFIKQVAYK